MKVSRQTFQRILTEDRKKIAESLVNGKAIRIEGGNLTSNICLVKCLSVKKSGREALRTTVKPWKATMSALTKVPKDTCAFGKGKRFVGDIVGAMNITVNKAEYKYGI